ncbi:LysR family transcriptional regulator [Photobacterium sanctipauli]|nr:LysR family transcriptional regulator [Photobacterium sanctipauli]
MPKSTVSRSISRLETDLNIRLLERNSRNLRLTTEGEQFYHHCQLMMEQLAATQATLSGFAQVPSGKLTVSLPAGFNVEFIQSELVHFLNQYPEIQLDLQIAHSHQDLYHGNIDLAVQIGPLPDSELIAIKLIESPQIWVGSPHYLEQYTDELQCQDVTITSLKKHSKIQLIHPQQYNFKMHFKGGEDVLFEPPVAQCNDALTVRQAVITGAGIALLPKLLVQRALNTGELIEFAKEREVHPKTALYAVYPSNKFLSEKTRLFIQFLKDAIANNDNKDD